jgi:hypothetical protein
MGEAAGPLVGGVRQVRRRHLRRRTPRNSHVSNFSVSHLCRQFRNLDGCCCTPNSVTTPVRRAPAWPLGRAAVSALSPAASAVGVCPFNIQEPDAVRPGPKRFSCHNGTRILLSIHVKIARLNSASPCGRTCYHERSCIVRLTRSMLRALDSCSDCGLIGA